MGNKFFLIWLAILCKRLFLLLISCEVHRLNCRIPLSLSLSNRFCTSFVLDVFEIVYECFIPHRYSAFGVLMGG